MRAYSWPLTGEFLNRSADLERLDAWWESPDRRPLALIGRRRVGKSWLFRQFANGKPAVLLVAEQLPPGAQLSRFSDQLEPLLGFRPDVRDLGDLLRVLYRAARENKLLAVIDEFPWLLGATSAQARRSVSLMQAVLEDERDQSRVKLVLCGSHVGQMEALFGERNPMHGRLIRAEVRPLQYAGAAQFLEEHDPVTAFERYAIAGGMPLYLAQLASGRVREAVCREVLDKNAPLWNEGRSIIEQELREPRVYFAILERLASGEKALDEVAQPLRLDGSAVSKYLNTLAELKLVQRRAPFGARPTSRGGHWRLADPFLRFWFRFGFPYQADLETGLRPADLYDAEVAPALPDHVSPVFEEWCREWLRTTHGHAATRIESWWGNAANRFRQTKMRSAEEIDAVGALRNRVTLIAECNWTARPADRSIVSDLDEYKIPALRDAGFKVVDQPTIVIFAKSGYVPGLVEFAKTDRRITLVDVPAELAAASRGC